MRKTRRNKQKYYPFKSKFEYEFANLLDKKGYKYEYEPDKLLWVPKPKTYCPDYKIWLSENKFYYIETKGNLRQDDRTKMKAIKEQYPDVDIRFVFACASNKINKRSKTTYADWADKHGYPWCECNFRNGHIELPKEWKRR